MDDRAQPPARTAAEDESAAVDGSEAIDASSPAEAETERMAGFHLDALRGWMLDGGIDAGDEDGGDGDVEELDVGRGSLHTIPLPQDELERLLLLTRGKIDADDDALEGFTQGRRERLITLVSAQDDEPSRMTPVPLSPRTMRGVEILLGAPMDMRAVTKPVAAANRESARRKRSRWRLSALLAAAFIVPAAAIGLRASALRGQAHTAQAGMMLAEQAPTEGSPEERGERANALREKAINAPPPSANETRGSALGDAHAALKRLRAGVLSCARETIGVLPGTSPPVPATLRLTRGDGYASAAHDWATPVWSCASFTMADPQHFQIQWQMVTSNTEGVGVAWIDDNEDGVPDRALGFHAKLADRGQPEAGEIEALDPTHPIASFTR